MTPEELDAIEARSNAATPGPWEVDKNGERAEQLVADEDTLNAIGPLKAFTLSGCWNATLAARSEDVAFIAAARSDVPRLVAEVRRLRAEASLMRLELCEAAETEDKADLAIKRLQAALDEAKQASRKAHDALRGLLSDGNVNSTGTRPELLDAAHKALA